MLKEAIEIIRERGSIEYAHKMAEGMVRKAWENVEGQLGECEGKANLEKLTAYLVDRVL